MGSASAFKWSEHEEFGNDAVAQEQTRFKCSSKCVCLGDTFERNKLFAIPHSFEQRQNESIIHIVTIGGRLFMMQPSNIGFIILTNRK